VENEPAQTPPTTTRIQDLPEGERPREKLARLGAAALSDAELLAIFFRTGATGMSAIELGRTLIDTHGSLSQLSRCTPTELARTKGIGPAKASELKAAFELGHRLAQERFSDTKLDNPEAIWQLLGQEMQSLHQESVRVVLLNTRLNLIKVEEIFRGTINESTFHPREVLRSVIIHSAFAFILVHNHPSGDASPSRADRVMTGQLKELSEQMQIRFLDHMIIGRNLDDREPFFSFREGGLI